MPNILDIFDFVHAKTTLFRKMIFLQIKTGNLKRKFQNVYMTKVIIYLLRTISINYFSNQIYIIMIA